MAKETSDTGAAKRPAKKAVTKTTAKKAAETTKVAAPAVVEASAPAAPATAATKTAKKRTVTSKVTKGAADKAFAQAAKPTAPQNLAKAATGGSKKTTITVRADAGFGNTFYLRGSGPGMTWDSGVAMTNKSADEWVWTTNEAQGEFEIKVLLNDSIWELGPNSTIATGEKAVLTPKFS